MNTPINENIKAEVCHENKSKFYWSAVIVGTLVGIGVSFLLNLFAIAIGVSAFIYTDAAQTFAIGGFIALIIIAIVSMGSLGWVSGYLGSKTATCHSHNAQTDDKPHCPSGCLYGFTAWCLALILTIFLSAHVGKFISFNRMALIHPNYIVDMQQNFESRPFEINRSSSDNNASIKNNVTPEEAAKTFALTTFVTFILFLIGALSAIIAGHCAFNAGCKHLKKYT